MDSFRASAWPRRLPIRAWPRRLPIRAWPRVGPLVCIGACGVVALVLLAGAARGADDDPEALYRDGEALRAAKNPGAAEMVFQRLVRIAPDDLRGRLGLARVQLEHAPADALETLDAARALAPNAEEVHWLRGRALEALGRLPEAAEAYRQAIRINPRRVEINQRLHQVLRTLGGRRTRVDEAAQRFYATPNLGTLSLFGRLLLDEATPQQAVTELEDARRRVPLLPEIDLWIARAQKLAGSLNGEIEAYERLLAADPKAAGVRLLLAVHLEEAGRLRQAGEALAPFDRDARLLAGLDRSERAQLAYVRSRVVLAHGDSAGSARALIEAAALGLDPALVRAAFQNDLASYPEEPELWSAWARWHERSGWPDRAVEAWLQAGLLDARQRPAARQALVAIQAANPARNVPAESASGGPAPSGAKGPAPVVAKGPAPVVAKGPAPSGLVPTGATSAAPSASAAGEAAAVADSARLALARLALADGQAQEALQLAEALPVSADARRLRRLVQGLAYRMLGQVAQSVAALTAYTMVETDSVGLARARGSVLWELGDATAAVAAWREQPGALHGRPDLLEHVATHLHSIGDAKAELAVRERLAALPGSLRANRVRLGDMYLSLGRSRDALAQWDAALAQNLWDFDLLMRVSRQRFAQGDVDAAAQRLFQANNLRPIPTEMALLLAEGRRAQGRLGDALSVYWQVYQQHPQESQVRDALPELAALTPADPTVLREAARLALETARPELAERLRKSLPPQ